MPELRRHYFLEEYCIIASERSKRPSDFLVSKAVPGDEKTCPFCPGNEDMTPPNVAVYTDKGVISVGSGKSPGLAVEGLSQRLRCHGPWPCAGHCRMDSTAGARPS